MLSPSDSKTKLAEASVNYYKGGHFISGCSRGKHTDSLTSQFYN